MHLDGYVRVSRVAGREGDSYLTVTDQTARIEAYAKANGHTIAEVFVDEDESGGKQSRPEFDKAMERAASGKTSGIIVSKLDRFARNTQHALNAISQLEQAGAILLAAEGNLPTDTAIGTALREVMFTFAQLERDRHRENFAAIKRSAIDRGIHGGAHPPAGYRRRPDRRLEPNEHAPAITKMFDMAAQGHPLAAIGRMLTEARVLTSAASAYWSSTSVRNALGNTVYLGVARQGDLRHPGAHSPLTTRATWEAAQQKRGQRGNTTGDYLLTGLLRCASCSYSMSTMRRSVNVDPNRARVYRCTKRHSSGVCPAPASGIADPIEEFVVAAFFKRLDTVTLVAESTAAPEVAELTLLVDQAEHELIDFRDELGIMAAIGRHAYLDGLSVRHGRVDELRGRLRALTRPSRALPAALSLRDVWERAEPLDRQRLLQSELEAVLLSSVGTGRRIPAHERVQLLWLDDHDGLRVPRPRRGRIFTGNPPEAGEPLLGEADRDR